MSPRRLQQHQEPNGQDFNCPVGDDWRPHREEAKSAMLKVHSMHGMLGGMAAHTPHLAALPEMAGTLASIDARLESMNESLVGPATGKKQVPVSVVLLLMLVLGAFMIVAFIRDSGMEVDFDSSGFRIRQRQDK